MYAKKNGGRKALILLVVLMLLVGIGAGGTVAWLMTSTEPLVNTFVEGNINIELIDTINFDGQFTIGNNTYESRKLLPGDSLEKAPRVKVLAGSEKCYVRMFTVVWWDDVADPKFVGSKSADWFTGSEITIDNHPASVNNYIDNTSNKVLGHVLEVLYQDPVDASVNNVTLPAPYTKINIPAYLTTEQYNSLNGCQVTVIAQAVQAEGFNSAAEAFEEVGYPVAQIPLRDTSMTLAELIEKHQNQAT